MSPSLEIWLAFAAALGAVWVVRLIAVGAVVRRRQVLTSRSYDGPPRPAPKVSIVLAAKDEESNVETCVTSLLTQDYPDFEFTVVDDRSCDRTPEILSRLAGQANGRLRVITVTRLRDGWFGKNNAMHEGVAASTGDWFLFTDADCRFVSPNAVSMAVREALASGAEFLTITPVLEAPTLWERVLQPVCALALILWFLPEKVNNPAKRTAYANGQFMLISRKCYESIGGHERVRAELNEDIQLARLAKKGGRRLRVVENDDLFRTRMYPNFAAAWRGWRRIFVGCLQTPRRLLVAASLLALFSLFPWGALVASILGWMLVPRSTGWLWSVAAWSVVVLLLQITTWRVYSMLQAGRAWSLAYPLGVLLTFGILVNALVKVFRGGTIVWRGTAYRGQQVESGVGVEPATACPVTGPGSVASESPAAIYTR